MYIGKLCFEINILFLNSKKNVMSIIKVATLPENLEKPGNFKQKN